MYQPATQAITNIVNQNQRHPELFGFEVLAWDATPEIVCFAGGICSSI
jgi:hypothetical protein